MLSLRPIGIAGLPLLFVMAGLVLPAPATIYISEFMADNDNVLLDSDGDSSDWIELYNDGTNAVSLAGWFLTDTPTNLSRWAFPATNIPARGFLLVFASGKDRAVAGAELHTSFRLNAGGEYVALTRPDGRTIESQFTFGPQLEDTGYGFAFTGGGSTSIFNLVASGASCFARIPTGAVDSVGWEQIGFDDSGWLSGNTGVGYENGTGYDPFIGLDVTAMHNINASVYIRIPFTNNLTNAVDRLTLRMKFDDGFAAAINGTPVAARNAPGSPAWNSTATSSHGDAQAVVFQDIDISAQAGVLQAGANVLTLHGLNHSIGSSDLLLLPELVAEDIDLVEGDIDLATTGLLAAATPGFANRGVRYVGLCEAPQVGPERGFYDAPFLVTLSNVTEGAVVRYTMDGSLPTETNGMLYTSPILVEGTTLLRARAFKPDYRPSPANTQTYLFIDDILQQDGSGLPPFGNWGHSGPDWELDPTMTHSVITNTAGKAFHLAEALLEIPTVSLVTDWDNWWSDAAGPTLPDGVTPWQGIYADPVGENAVRRPVSMEYFESSGEKEFAEDGVVSIVGGGIGGTSANRWKTDKLSMRVTFTEKLDYAVYGNKAAQKFNTLVLDAHLAWTWTHPSAGQQSAPKMLTDAIASDYQNGMSGKGAPHSKFVHLYLNGLYWGLYEMHERPDEHFAAEYFGGANEDYDSIKHWANDSQAADSDHDGDPFNDNLTNGDDADYNAMLALSRNDLSQPANYAALVAELDIEVLIDYLLVNFYLGNGDWAHKNWYATHNRIDPLGRWRYHSWDVEHVMETSFTNPDLNGALAFDVTGKDNAGGPTEVHQNLTANPEYRLLFADHIHRHFFNGGVLSTQRATDIFWARVMEIEQGMLGEAARWADNRNLHDYSEWIDHMVDLRDIYFPERSTRVFNQLKARGLYPDTAAPVFTANGVPMHGGLIASGDHVGMQSDYVVYYTTDGTDPRSTGGGVAGMPFTAPLSFDRPTRVRARAKNGDEWSALSEADFWTSDIPLAVTELMYHAPGGNAQDYIEIRNISADPVPLHGYKFDGAISFEFSGSAVPILAPGAFLVVVKDFDAFAATYPANGILIAGEYRNDFDNSGEEVQLEFWNQDLITFRYSDARDWPQAADGAGASLVALERAIPDEERGSLNYGRNWRASTFVGGSPGLANPDPMTSVLLNEITAHTDSGNPAPFDSNDQIELYNTTDAPVDLTGWFLSDDLEQPHKWAVPSGTIIQAMGFLVFDEDDFHPGRTAGFGLGKSGEQVVLSAPGRVADAVRFKGQENGVSWGRYPDGVDDWRTTLLTPGAPNQPVDPDIWIRAMMYNPPAPDGQPNGNGVEFIQLENRGVTPITFTNTAGAWRMNGGISYTFPAGTTLLPCEKLWLVSFDPADALPLDLFADTYGLDPLQAMILGPYAGQLSDRGERVALERPQGSDNPLQPSNISWVVVDEVFYFDQAPWPSGADGTGDALVRVGLNDWTIAAPDPCNPLGFKVVVLAENPCPNDNQAELQLTVLDPDCAATGGMYEASIDGGQTWTPTLQFSGLTNGCYVMQVRRNGTTNCPSALQTQMLATVDTQPPEFDLPADALLECPADIHQTNIGMASNLIDNLDPAPTLTLQEQIATGACPNHFILKRTWTATDCSGNTTSQTQTITVQDTTAPIMDCPDDLVITHLPVPDPQLVVAFDLCDTNPAIEVSVVPVSSNASHDVMHYVYTAVDACGNSNQCTQTITRLHPASAGRIDLNASTLSGCSTVGDALEIVFASPPLTAGRTTDIFVVDATNQIQLVNPGSPFRADLLTPGTYTVKVVNFFPETAVGSNIAGFGISDLFVLPTNGQFDVAEATVMISSCLLPTEVNFANTDIVYGASLTGVLNATATGPDSDEIRYFLPSGEVVTISNRFDVGAYEITAIHPGGPTHRPGSNTAILTVTPAPLTITADDQTRTVDETNPVFTVSFRGFVNGDRETDLDQPLQMHTTADTNSPIGTYPISVTNATDANYTIFFANGTLTVTEGEDPDLDGLTTAEEAILGTDPNKADTDGDGFDDGDEVTLATDPRNALSHLKIISLTTPGGTTHHATWPSAPGIQYRLEATADLVNPKWTAVGVYTGEAGEVVMIQTDASGLNIRAYRVVWVPDP